MKNQSFNVKIIILIMCHALFIIGLLLFVKREYHSDEIWSFGIANGSYGGAVFQDSEGTPINNNKWMSAEVFHENLTVQEEERFHFSMPYDNSVNDAHPPLSFMLIHLLSSFFPDQFSFWFYIPINILALILCDIYLYKTMKLYNLPDSICLGACFLYAFCAGGISTMLYIRMYALLTAFAVMILYLSTKVYLEKEVTLKGAVSLICVCFLGSFTEYEFYVYAFILTIVTGLLLLINKKVKVTFQYGLCMALGVLISLILFPEFFRDVLGNINGEGFDSYIAYPYDLQFRMLINMTLRDIIGFAPSIYSPFGDLFTNLGIILYILLVLAPLFFLLRKTPWFISGIKKIKEYLGLFRNSIVKYHFILIVCWVEYVAMICIFNALVSVYHMGATSVRYFFIIYPVLTMLIVLLIYCVTKNLRGKADRWLYVTFIVALCIMSQLKGGHAFLGQDSLEGKGISDVNNSNIIVVNKSFSDVERICHMIDSSNFYFSVEFDDLEAYSEQIKNVPLNTDIYLILSEGVLLKNVLTEKVESQSGEAFHLDDVDYKEVKKQNEKKFVEQLKELGICEECKYLGKEKMLNTTFYYYKLKI